MIKHTTYLTYPNYYTNPIYPTYLNLFVDEKCKVQGKLGKYPPFPVEVRGVNRITATFCSITNELIHKRKNQLSTGNGGGII